MPQLQLYAAGSNSHGQLGTGSEDDAHVFKKCDINIEIKDEDIDTLDIKICAGANHTLLFVSHGNSTQELFVAGSSRRGQLGRINEENKLSFERLSLKSLLADAERAIGLSSSIDAASYQDWAFKDTAAAWETSFFLLENTRFPHETMLLACGSNDFGHLGSQNTTQTWSTVSLPVEEKVTRIVSGPRHTVIATEGGRVYGWGSSRHGQLGTDILASVTYIPTPLLLEGRVTGTQDSIALGNQHTCTVVTAGGTNNVILLGNNRKGQLNTSDAKARGNKFNLARTEDSAESDIKEVAVYANWNSTFVLDRLQNKLYSFGNNASGQLGRDDASSSVLAGMGEVDLGSSSRILQVAAGSEHTLALLKMEGIRQVWGWGWNEHGNLGKGGDSDSLQDARKPVRIAVPDSGRVHSVHAGNGTSWLVLLDSTD